MERIRKQMAPSVLDLSIDEAVYRRMKHVNGVQINWQRCWVAQSIYMGKSEWIGRMCGWMSGLFSYFCYHVSSCEALWVRHHILQLELTDVPRWERAFFFTIKQKNVNIPGVFHTSDFTSFPFVCLPSINSTHSCCGTALATRRKRINTYILLLYYKQVLNLVVLGPTE